MPDKSGKCKQGMTMLLTENAGNVPGTDPMRQHRCGRGLMYATADGSNASCVPTLGVFRAAFDVRSNTQPSKPVLVHWLKS
eukprot:1154015-Pelagomonas_calceolata.AAC.3